MTYLVVGVIGHVDHGKTALVRALTGQDTDRLPEEKRRGISIALGFASLHIDPDTDIDLIDMPGHERFVRTMISGAAGIDAALLVVAANEGVRPQTREHVDIARLLGLKRAAIVVTKTDLASREEAAHVADEAMRLLASAGIDAPAPALASATRGEGLAELRVLLGALAEHVAGVATARAGGLAYLPIDRAFTVAGHGPVATGTLRGGPVAVGDTLELLPSRRKVRIRAVERRGARVATAAPGRRVALNLRDIDIADLKRGMTLAAPEALTPSDWLTIAVRAVAAAPPLKNGMRLRALFGAGEVAARLRLLDREALAPGEAGLAQLHCAEAVAVPAGERVILRLPSPPQTVGGGRILEPETRRLRRYCPLTVQRLEDLRTLAPKEMFKAELERAGPAGASVRRLSQLSALAPARVVDLLRSLATVVTCSGTAVRQSDVDDAQARIPVLLAPHEAGLSQGSLLTLLGGGDAALEEALERLMAAGAVARRGGQFLIPHPDKECARAEREAALALDIAYRLRGAGLGPPDPRVLVVDAPSSRAVDRLLGEGVIVRALDRAKGKEILFHRDAIDDARRRLAPLLANTGGLLVTEIGAALGISRKFSMPLLDHLDTIRFTRRIGDRRVLGHMLGAPTSSVR